MNALDICNACDVNEADPGNPGGYCTECQAAANEAGTLAARCPARDHANWLPHATTPDCIALMAEPE